MVKAIESYDPCHNQYCIHSGQCALQYLYSKVFVWIVQYEYNMFVDQDTTGLHLKIVFIYWSA